MYMDPNEIVNGPDMSIFFSKHQLAEKVFRKAPGKGLKVARKMINTSSYVSSEGVEQMWNKRGTDVEQAWNKRGTSVERIKGRGSSFRPQGVICDSDPFTHFPEFLITFC